MARLPGEVEALSMLDECAPTPADMTIQHRRRRRSAGSRPKRRHEARPLSLVRGPASPPAVRCDHVHESTTRYDHDRKVLSFLLVCPVCGIERVMETMDYEPRFEPHSAPPLADAA
jgi:hypothetical protein